MKTKTKEYKVEFVQHGFEKYQSPVKAASADAAASKVARRVGADAANKIGSTRYQAVSGGMRGLEFWIERA